MPTATATKTAFLEELGGASLQSVARGLLAGSQKAAMRVVYAKRPMTDPNDGHPLKAAGHVTWIDKDLTTGSLWQKIAVGWTVLDRYGEIHAYQEDGVSPWSFILRHPDGPREFPVDQLLEFGWYDAAKCERDTGVPNVRFPQLRGQVVTQIPCPECTDRFFLKPIHLARHCRNHHQYDRLDIEALGRQLGVDFMAELFALRPREVVYGYEEEEAPEAVIEEPLAQVETVHVAARPNRLRAPESPTAQAHRASRQRAKRAAAKP